VELRLLGPLELVVDGRPVKLPAGKPRLLLALLLLDAGRVVPGDRLIGGLWGDEEPATAAKVVQGYISRLRKLLPDGVLETRDPGYVVILRGDELDLHRFERLRQEAAAAAASGRTQAAKELLVSALKLWRGPPLADVADELRLPGELARLEELRLVTLEDRIETELALGEAGHLVGELEALVAEHPLRERLRAQLMLALYRSGRQADALATYKEARASLAEELGLDPGQALKQLEKAILRQDPALELPMATPKSSTQAPPPSSRSDEAPPSRKLVTVLFCEVAAPRDVDPESLRLRTERFLDRATAVVANYGGTLRGLVGDELMAVYGVPAVREDDTLRAIRAAMELRNLGSDRGVDLEVRVGVSTGEVVTGDHGDVTGSAVTTGKRLAQKANPGEIVLGEATYATVAHAVDVLRQEPGSYRLESIDPEATAVPRRDDARFVGRERELDRLRSLYAGVAAGEGARLVTVVGEPGIGKSRLVREAFASLEREATVLVGRCPPYGEGVTFWPLRELLRQAGRDGELTGSSHEVFATVRRLLVELAAKQPVVVGFDDIHWAEPTFLDLVEYLESRLGEAQVLIVCQTRPQLTEERPTWLQPPAELITLQPLSAEDSALLLESLGVPTELHAQIAEAAEGNPLFAEQLAANAGEDGSSVSLPGSIRSVLQERLDRLDRTERAVLERASVAGRSFSLGSVIDLSPSDEADAVHQHLLSLVRKRFVRPDTIALDEGFRFQHALIRDATYDAMPKASRADLHGQTAGRLTALGADDALVAYHLEQAFLLRRDLGELDAELGARAGALLVRAAREAFARSDAPAAISLLERARALVAEDDPSFAALLTELAYGRRKLGDFARAEADLDEAVEAAGRLGDRRAELRAHVERQFARSWVAAGASAEENVRLARAARSELGPLGDDLGLAWAWWLESDGELRACRWRHRAEALEHALEHARRVAHPLDFVSTFQGLLAQALLYGPTPVPEAVARVEQLLAEAVDPAVRATLNASLAGLLAMSGDVDAARAIYADAAAAFDDLGLRLRRANHALIGAQVELIAGEPGAAERELRDARAVLAGFGAQAVASTHAAVLAHVLCTLDRLEEAEALAREAAESAPEDDVGTQAVWRSALGRVLIRRDALEEAGSLVDEAVRLTDGVEFPSVRIAALAAAAQVASAQGRGADAQRLVAEAQDVAAAKGNVVEGERLLQSVARPE
jgi:DNA-binding SARP family transcriptional activator